MTNQPPTLTTGTDLGADADPRADTDLRAEGDLRTEGDLAVERLSVSDDTDWHPGSHQNGLDDRVQFAEVGDRVAVRDPERPAAPPLLLHRADWEDLCATATTEPRNSEHPNSEHPNSEHPTSVDLRD
jgi:hypothetical protein